MNLAEQFYNCGPLPERNTWFLVPLGQEPATVLRPEANPSVGRRKPLAYSTIRRFFHSVDTQRDFICDNVAVRKRSGPCCRPYVRYDMAFRETDRPKRKRNAALTDAAAEVMEQMARSRDRLHAYTMVPCRQCVPCLRYRRRDWYERTRAEALYCISKYTQKVRSREGASCGIWMMAFTFSPAGHAKSRDVAMDACADQGVDYSTLTADEQFDARMKWFYNPVYTRFIDRVEYEGPFRYILVSEIHEGEHPGGSGANLGECHQHMILLETDPDRPLSKDGLVAAWRFDPDAGFVRAQLCRYPYVRGHPGLSGPPLMAGPGANKGIGACVNYICEYLTKSPVCRIRKSNDFGHPEKWDAKYLLAERLSSLHGVSGDIRKEPGDVPRGSVSVGIPQVSVVAPEVTLSGLSGSAEVNCLLDDRSAGAGPIIQ